MFVRRYMYVLAFGAGLAAACGPAPEPDAGDSTDDGGAVANHDSGSAEEADAGDDASDAGLLDAGRSPDDAGLSPDDAGPDDGGLIDDVDAGSSVDAGVEYDGGAPVDAGGDGGHEQLHDAGPADGGSEAVCTAEEQRACYTGPQGTEDVGLCRAGTETCNASGTGWGPCTGQVTPTTELCETDEDEDCDGASPSCPTTSFSDVHPIFQNKCASCHTSGGSGGHNIGHSDAATAYQQSQQTAYSVSGTKGAAALFRIQNGTMPQGRGCSGDPAQDASNAACLTAAEQSLIQTWLDEGQPE